jgi:succinate dehydrogenase / fumarate reductase cytochrome b subunit
VVAPDRPNVCRALQGVALGVAVVLVAGFLSVPFAVLTGLVA